MKKVAIIGHFGGKETFYDGQTIKTKNLEALLSGQKDLSVRRVDTYYSKRNKVKLLWETLRALLACEHIFLLVSVNGMKVFLPLLHHLNRFAKRHIYHYVIGSELLELVEQDRGLVRYLNSLDANWFEYESGTRRLQQYGVKNVVTVPNFKNLTPVPEASEYRNDRSIHTFCTFSRVMREKGITEAVEAVSRLNAEASGVIARLDIYGPVDSSYQEEFDRLLTQHPDCVTYKGCVDSQKSVETLKDYYALLFPTRWAGEGLPGTVIDAYAAGVPVIATDWNANKEIIAHGKQGIIYPSDGLETLYDAVVWAMEHEEAWNRMRVTCRAEFTRYMPETVLALIRDTMNK